MSALHSDERYLHYRRSDLTCTTDLFYQGQRPAVDVGISVSRVGGSAQVKSMKSVAGTLRLDLAAYRELHGVYPVRFRPGQAATQQQLTRGAAMTELLKQGRYTPDVRSKTRQLLSRLAARASWTTCRLRASFASAAELLDYLRALQAMAFWTRFADA